MRSLVLLSMISLSSASAALTWKSCTLDNFPPLSRIGADKVLPDIANLSSIDCAELHVPVDWSSPHGGNITLGMTRYKGTKAGKRLGSIIYNPGGPGGVASTAPIEQALGSPAFTNGTVDNYDVIGLDPRGIGMSTPVRCDPGLFNKRPGIFPKTEEEFEALVKANKAFGESCKNLTGELFFHFDTTSAARDIEALRVALGEDKLNWIGLSYGTQLGGAYAELYPENVGRMVLDGNLDHSQSETGFFVTESSTYEDTLNQFFNWCNETTVDECPFKGQDLPRMYDDLVAAADGSPISAPSCRGNQSDCKPFVTGEDIRINTQPGLVRKASWPILAQHLNDTIEGNGSTLSSALATSETDGNYPDLAIGCSDWQHSSKSISDVLYKSQLASYLAPHTKGASQSYRYQLQCLGWPAPVSNPPHRLNQTAMSKAPPILMVNAFHDPETSYVWAVNLKEQIPSGVLLTRDGDGHTSYSLQGGETVALIDEFLATGVLPKANTVVDS